LLFCLFISSIQIYVYVYVYINIYISIYLCVPITNLYLFLICPLVKIDLCVTCPKLTFFVCLRCARVEIPPGPAADDRVRVRHVSGEGDLPRAHHRGAAGGPAAGDVGEPPPRPPHPAVGPHGAHRHPQGRRRPHGGVHPPQSDGHAYAWFTAGFRERGPAWTTPTYAYPNVQSPGGALWYHDHALGLTRANLLAGLLGAYVVRNPAAEAPLGLPRGDAFDRVLVLADRSFYADGSLYMNRTGDNPGVHPQWQPEYFGEAVTVNGKAWPFLRVARRRYRFRVINASNARFFNLSLSASDGLSLIPLHVVGSDTSYLPRPVAVTHLLVAAAEAFDVVVDFSECAVPEAELVNTAPYPYPDGDAPNHLNGKVMKFVVEPARVRDDDDSRVPARLLDYVKVAEEDAARRRYIVLYEYEDEATGDPTHLYINGKRLEDPATETPRPGSTEVWEVINLTQDNHPLHLHLATFQAVRARELDGLEEFKHCMERLNDAVRCDVGRHAVGEEVAVPEHERTWKNVVKIAPGFMTTVVVKFLMVDTGRSYPFDATAEPGYVYHCHVRN
jgi:FtsP/CotA-like multicopper oxidase with cupredoxin domain